MKIALVVLAAGFLFRGNALSHPEPRDSVERIPPGTQLTALRDINVKPRTRHTIVADGSYSCTLHHDISEEDRVLRSNTVLVLGGIVKGFYGPKGDLYEAHFHVSNMPGWTLECSGETRATLPIAGMTSILKETFRFEFPLPREIGSLGPAASSLQGGAQFD